MLGYHALKSRVMAGISRLLAAENLVRVRETPATRGGGCKDRLLVQGKTSPAHPRTPTHPTVPFAPSVSLLRTPTHPTVLLFPSLPPTHVPSYPSSHSPTPRPRAPPPPPAGGGPSWRISL